MSTATAERPTTIRQSNATAIAEYDPLAAGLADLAARFGGVIFDVATTSGDKAAREARREMVSLRGTVEKTRKALKAPALDYSRLIDTEAKRIDTEILALETPIDAQIKAQEAAKEAERKAKADAEAARVGRHRAMIQAMRGVALSAWNYDPLDLEEHITRIGLRDFSSCEEFQPEAEAARAEAITALRSALADRDKQAAEAANLAAEREELAKLRREQAAREADRVAKAARDAEQAKIDAERAQLRREQADERARRDAILAAESEAKTRAEKAGPALLSHLVQITTAYDLGDFPSLGEAIDSARLTVIDATL